MFPFRSSLCKHGRVEQEANPFLLDRTIILAATVGALARFTCWLETRCECRSCTQIPVPLLAKQGQASRTIADVLLRLKCKRCGKSPASVELVEWIGKQETFADGRLPWRVELLRRP
jgi:hypothetical protein